MSRVYFGRRPSITPCSSACDSLFLFANIVHPRLETKNSRVNTS